MNRNELLNDNEDALRLALDGRQSTIWTAIPCTVLSVNFTDMTIEAQPTIQGTQTLDNGDLISIDLPPLLDVPLVFPSAGGFILTMPIAAGDEVLVVFASRCIDAWWQSGGIQRPLEIRMHDLSDGFAIPGPRSLPNTAPSISSTAAQLRNNAGTTYLEIAANGTIKLLSTSTIRIQAPSIVLDGAVTATGDIGATGDVTAGAVSLKNHVHSPGSLNAPPGGGPVTGATGVPT